MLDAIRDPAWQFIGAVLALIAIAVSLRIYLAQRSRKRLLVETVARVPLVTAGAKGIPGLEIRINDRRLDKASVLLVRVENIGNSPILATDIEEPLSLELADGAVVLSADIGESRPRHLPTRATFAGRTVTIERHLLNPGDMFTCRMLVENSRGGYTARARIAGVQDLERRRRSSLLQPIGSFVCVIVVVGALYLSPAPKSVGLSELRTEEVPFALVALFGLVTLLVLTTRELVVRIRSLRDRMLLLSKEA